MEHLIEETTRLLGVKKAAIFRLEQQPARKHFNIDDLLHEDSG